MDITLYGSTDTNAWRVQWMLNELQEPYKHISFDIHATGAKTDPVYEEILGMNPNGTVPVLRRGEEVLWDSLAINLYLADVFTRIQPEGGLVHAMKWSLWAAELEPPLQAAQSHHTLLPRDRRNADEAAKARGSLVRPFEKLDRWLERSPYLEGAEFTVADLNVVCVLARFSDGGFDEDSWPNLRRWMRACGERSALAEVFG